MVFAYGCNYFERDKMVFLPLCRLIRYKKVTRSTLKWLKGAGSRDNSDRGRFRLVPPWPPWNKYLYRKTSTILPINNPNHTVEHSIWDHLRSFWACLRVGESVLGQVGGKDWDFAKINQKSPFTYKWNLILFQNLTPLETFMQSLNLENLFPC